jgi:hypothetical protein
MRCGCWNLKWGHCSFLIPILAPILSRYQDALRVLEPKMKGYRQAYAAWAPKA